MSSRLRLSIGTVLAAVLALGGCSANASNMDDWLAQDAAGLQAASAEAMGEVTSVRFMLERTGAFVFIDPAASISVNTIEGRFAVPSSADAIVQVTVNDALNTKLGAVAIDDEVWLSNPVTGKLETLPPGFDIDPSLFFDPKGGWQPLLADLTNVTFIGVEKRNDQDAFHLTGTAPAARMQAITAGLVRDQDVELDLWLDPVTAEVTAIDFSTVFDGETSDWKLGLVDYGETFTISAPEE